MGKIAEIRRINPFLLSSLALLPFIIWRFYRITEVGIYGSDVFYYWQTAYEWSQGQWGLTQHFRPTAYFFHNLAFKLFGFNDWNIKALHLVLDALISLMMLRIGNQLRSSWVVGLFAALFYLSLPYTLIHSREETVHTPTTFLLFLSLWSMLTWTRNYKPVQLFLAGLFHGLAWTVHPDIAVLGLPYVLTITYKVFKSNRTQSNQLLNDLLRLIFIYVLGYAVPMIFYFSIYGVHEILGLIQYAFGTHNIMLKPFYWRLWEQVSTYFWTHFSLIGTTTFLITFFFFIKSKTKTSDHFFLLVTPVFYITIVSLLIGRVVLPRLFLPLVPFIILFIAVVLWDQFKSRHMLWFNLILIASMPEGVLFPLNQDISIYKKIDKELSPHLIQKGQYLITPLSIQHYHEPLRRQVYLNGRGRYLVYTYERTFEDIIKKHDISYVWIADQLYDPHTFGENLGNSYKERLNTLFEMSPENYSVEEEKNRMENYLLHRGAELTLKSTLGRLYQLKRTSDEADKKE